MRIVFMGSADLSCPCLDVLLKSGKEVVGVVTQPDRPKGRNLRMSPSPVRVLAEARGIPVLTPEKINTPSIIDSIAAMAPDVIVVVAYGQILRKEILRIPPRGCVNMHTSLLPGYRGAAPIQWAIVNGENVTGVTAMFMNERMDAGDIIYQREVAISKDETGGSLHDKLAAEAALLLKETVENMCSGEVPRRPQVESEATFAPKLNKKDGRIDWTSPADKIYNRIRAFNPWPCCYCEAGPEKSLLRVLKTRVEPTQGTPGQIIDSGEEGPLVACGQGGLRLLEVQPEGRKVMSGADYLRGRPVHAGDILH